MSRWVQKKQVELLNSLRCILGRAIDWNCRDFRGFTTIEQELKNTGIEVLEPGAGKVQAI